MANELMTRALPVVECLEWPDDLARRVEELRASFLKNEGPVAIQTHPIAEQHVLLALGALETAQRHLMLAHYDIASALGARQRG